MNIEHNQKDGRFQVAMDGGVAFTEYVLDGQTMRLVHTKVPEALEGQGLASKVVTAAFEYARANNLKVVPICEYVVGYLKRHTEYHDLIVPDSRA